MVIMLLPKEHCAQLVVAEAPKASRWMVLNSGAEFILENAGRVDGTADGGASTLPVAKVAVDKTHFRVSATSLSLTNSSSLLELARWLLTTFRLSLERR
jgi:hypothetical protein